MLLRFVVSNFLSFAEEVEFNMFPGNFKIHKDHVYHTPEVDLLKTAAVYGANGAGKSNFVKAMFFLRNCIFKGNLPNESYGKYSFKLDEIYSQKVTSMEIEVKLGKQYYAYGIDILQNAIQKEWLYKISPSKKNEELIFERKTDGEKTTIEVHKKYKKSEKDKLRFEIYAEDLLSNNLFVFRAKEHIQECNELSTWAKNNSSCILPNSEFILMENYTKDKSFRDFAQNLLTNTGTGLSEVNVEALDFNIFFNEENPEDIKKAKELETKLSVQKGKLRFQYKGKNYIAFKEGDNLKVQVLKTYSKNKNNKKIEFGYDELSDGTQRLLHIIPALYMLRNFETVIVIDEIERSLHPALIKEFLELFLSQPAKGQLIFTTHESYLLDFDLFRQDEIWFAEKNKEGATSMYSLSEFKPRYDLDIRKGYLAGRFGAIPFLGNLKELNWSHAEEQGV